MELQIPSFSKGIVKKEVNVCSKCLEAVNEAYIRFKREEIDEMDAYTGTSTFMSIKNIK